MSQSSKLAQMDAETRRLLDSLVKRGVLELKPTMDREGVHYVEVEKDLKDADRVHVGEILQSLVKQGILESEIVDRVLTCPDCGSPEVHSKYACPKCRSYNVEYTELIEHMKCGHIGQKDKFMKGSSLVCPGCQADLSEEVSEHRVGGRREKQVEISGYAGVKYLVIGSCYQCEKCGYRFDKPEIVHFCRKCERTFTYQEAKYTKILSYRISSEAVGTLGRDLPILENVRKVLTEEGFDVQLNAQMTGVSGVQHSFDALAEKDDASLVIDVSIAGSKNDMISLLGKKVDVNPTKAIIIDLSNLDELTALGKVYDIAVLKPTDNHNAPDEFRDFLATLRSTEAKR